MLTPININGASYVHPAQDVNFQECINMYLTSSGEEGRSKSALLPTPGLSLLIDTGAATIRGLFGLNDTLFCVADSNVYKLTVNAISLTASKELIGTIGTTSGPVSMANDTSQFLLVDGSTAGYIYNFNTTGTSSIGPIGGTAGDTYTLTINGVSIYSNLAVSSALADATLTAAINGQSSLTGVSASLTTGVLRLTATDDRDILVAESGTGFTAGTDGITLTGSDFTTTREAFLTIDDTDFRGGITTQALDQYFFVNVPDTAEMMSSGLSNAEDWDVLETVTAESKPDKLKALAVHKGELWAFGENSIEVWNNTANASGFPFSKLPAAGMEVGCGATFSVVEMDNVLLWLDGRGFIVQSDDSNFIRNNSSGYTIKVVSTEAINTEIANYTRLDDAIACQYNHRGHLMYQITFPTANKTWVYDYTIGAWHRRTHLDQFTRNEDAHLAQYCVRYNNRNIVAGIYSGKIYVMSHDYKTDNGQPIRRIRQTAFANAGFKIIGVNYLEIRMMTGTVGDDDNPQVVLQYSNNGGHTWSNELPRDMGRIGEYNKPIRWNRLGSATEWLLRFIIVSPVDFALIDAAADISELEL